MSRRPVADVAFAVLLMPKVRVLAPPVAIVAGAKLLVNAGGVVAAVRAPKQ